MEPGAHRTASNPHCERCPNRICIQCSLKGEADLRGSEPRLIGCQDRDNASDLVGMSVSPLTQPAQLPRQAIMRVCSRGYSPWVDYIQDLRRKLGPRPLIMVGAGVVHVGSDDRLLLILRTDSGM